MRPRQKGFTLIELMIVVAIIGILSALAVPNFANMVLKAKEGTTKGNLGVLRSALSIYYGDTEGTLPSDNLSCLITGGKYIKNLPARASSVPHRSAIGVLGTVLDDGAAASGWVYGNNPLITRTIALITVLPLVPPPPPTITVSVGYGLIAVNCYHLDSRGSSWYSY